MPFAGAICVPSWSTVTLSGSRAIAEQLAPGFATTLTRPLRESVIVTNRVGKLNPPGGGAVVTGGAVGAGGGGVAAGGGAVGAGVGGAVGAAVGAGGGWVGCGAGARVAGAWVAGARVATAAGGAAISADAAAGVAAGLGVASGVGVGVAATAVAVGLTVVRGVAVADGVADGALRACGMQALTIITRAKRAAKRPKRRAVSKRAFSPVAVFGRADGIYDTRHADGPTAWRKRQERASGPRPRVSSVNPTWV